MSGLQRVCQVCHATAVLLALCLDCGRAAAEELDRSPVDLALGPGGTWLATANQTSDSVSLVDLGTGTVLDEIAVGDRPEAVVSGPGGDSLLVSCSDEGTVEWLRAEGNKLRVVERFTTGFWPHGLALSRDNEHVYVALAASNEVVRLDLSERRIDQRFTVGRWPRYLALNTDETRLTVGTSGDRGVTVIDLQHQQVAFQEKFMGLNIGHLQVSRDGKFAYFPWMVYRHNPISEFNIKAGWVLASRVARLALDQQMRREALSLDVPGRAVADPFGLGLTRDEQTLVISASGTHELLVMRLPDLPLQGYGGTDHLPPDLREDVRRFDRVELGGRPMGLRISADDRTVYVANYLRNSVQAVDLATRQVVAEFPLGGPAEPSLVRRGEAIFHDARYSLDQWYSCHSCHYNGGGNSERMDTFNDDSPFTFKTVLPLYRLADTAPWTWHGWQTDLGEAMRKSITSTMQGQEPNDDDVRALVAYLSQLEAPRNPFRLPDGSLSAAAQRGKQVFESTRAGCANCHQGPQFTDGKLHDVGLGKPEDRYPTFNTPTLIGVGQRVRLLHDGRANSLQEVLTGPHSPARVAGEGELTADELADLIAYLQTL